MRGLADARFNSLMASFNALLGDLRKAERTINEQDPAKEHLKSTIETLSSLAKAVEAAYKSK